MRQATTKLYTTGYAAARIGVTPAAVRQWIESGRAQPDAVLYGVEKKEKGATINVNDIAYCWTLKTIYAIKRAWKAGRL